MTTVSVFGGTGFLGRRLVRRLAAEGATVRVAVRHAERARSAYIRARGRGELSSPAGVSGRYHRPPGRDLELAEHLLQFRIVE